MDILHIGDLVVHASHHDGMGQIGMMNVLTEENGQLIAIDQFEHSLSFFTE